MKRHPALRELSSDHHHGLVQARRLMLAVSGDRASPATLMPAARAFLDFWAHETRPHFRAEEEALLPAFARYADPNQPPIVRILLEHIRIRQLVAELERAVAGDTAAAPTMQALGELLHAHIRYEEDVFFPLLEASMPEEELAALPAAIAAIASSA
ncbi:MAG: hemerythrin domain-containing protein [Candidatus Chloroheliales bacterium]|nr:MAG: hemerythrin domain-containing protein [Chloroflexota bacterium]